MQVNSATSPDGKLTLSAVGVDDGCVATLTEIATGKVLLTIPFSELTSGDTREHFDAFWKKDSSALALDAVCGRSITHCYVYCRVKSIWKPVTFPKKQMAEIVARNNRDEDKSLGYLEATKWQGDDTLLVSYMGNIGIVNDLEFRLIRTSKPYLELLKAAAQPNG